MHNYNKFCIYSHKFSGSMHIYPKEILVPPVHCIFWKYLKILYFAFNTDKSSHGAAISICQLFSAAVAPAAGSISAGLAIETGLIAVSGELMSEWINSILKILYNYEKNQIFVLQQIDL